MPRVCDRERRACVCRVWPLWGCDLHPLPAARCLVQVRGRKEPCHHAGPKVREQAATLAGWPKVEVAAIRWLVAGLEPTRPSEVGDAVARDEEFSRRHDAHTRCALLLEHTGRLSGHTQVIRLRTRPTERRVGEDTERGEINGRTCAFPLRAACSIGNSTLNFSRASNTPSAPRSGQLHHAASTSSACRLRRTNETPPFTPATPWRSLPTTTQPLARSLPPWWLAAHLSSTIWLSGTARVGALPLPLPPLPPPPLLLPCLSHSSMLVFGALNAASRSSETTQSYGTDTEASQTAKGREHT